MEEKEKIEVNNYNGIDKNDFKFLMMYFILFEVIATGLFLIMYDFISNISENLFDIVYEISFYGTMTVMAVKFYLDDFKKCFKIFKKNWFKIILILLVVHILDTLIENFVDIIMYLPEPENQQLLNEAFMKFPIVEIVTTVIFAPIIEEIVFRHILIGKLSGKIPLFVAALISILLFAFVHSGFTISFFSYITGSIILALIYIKSGKNFVVTIIYHIFWNLIATISIFI